MQPSNDPIHLPLSNDIAKVPSRNVVCKHLVVGLVVVVAPKARSKSDELSMTLYAKGIGRERFLPLCHRVPNTMDHSWRKPPRSENTEESEELLLSTVPSGEVCSKSALSLQLLYSCLKYAVLAVLFFVFGWIFNGKYLRNERASSGT
jgi:hypothetical protein